MHVRVRVCGCVRERLMKLTVVSQHSTQFNIGKNGFDRYIVKIHWGCSIDSMKKKHLILRVKDLHFVFEHCFEVALPKTCFPSTTSATHHRQNHVPVVIESKSRFSLGTIHFLMIQ